ncbi:hypothetical protein DPMN_146727 [Dreissena polymorpha]|uniref:Uncharacterized protein n=1 Tax=Dreissena polymorpha TaxID=45954 RepID=A0A9D4IYN8_DREPO|nr:hypothetical protein DPMN_146727 [Dreissena polymorpha]
MSYNVSPSLTIAGRALVHHGMIHINYLTRSQYFPVPPRLKPVNILAEPGQPRIGYGSSRLSPGRATVVAGYAPVEHR